MHVEDAKRYRPPKSKITLQLAEDIVRAVTCDRYGREKTTRILAGDFDACVA